MMSSAVLCATQIKSRNDPVTNLLDYAARQRKLQFQLHIDMAGRTAYVKACSKSVAYFCASP